MQPWTSGSIAGKFVYLTPGRIAAGMSPANRVFYAKGGFGCEPDTLGTKVFGRFCVDGSEGYVRRSEVMGILTPDEADAIVESNTEPTLKAV